MRSSLGGEGAAERVVRAVRLDARREVWLHALLEPATSVFLGVPHLDHAPAPRRVRTTRVSDEPLRCLDERLELLEHPAVDLLRETRNFTDHENGHRVSLLVCSP